MVPPLVTVEIVAVPIFLSFLFFFLPFRLSHLKPKKKNQRIGCCGFVNFLGASRILMNFLGL